MDCGNWQVGHYILLSGGLVREGQCGVRAASGWHLMRKLLRFSVEAGKLKAMEAIELGPRGKSALP